MGVAWGTPFSPRGTPILNPGEVGPSCATTTPAPGSPARAAVPAEARAPSIRARTVATATREREK